MVPCECLTACHLFSQLQYSTVVIMRPPSRFMQKKKKKRQLSRSGGLITIPQSLRFALLVNFIKKSKIIHKSMFKHDSTVIFRLFGSLCMRVYGPWDAE
jgi:hypothetical protein